MRSQLWLNGRGGAWHDVARETALAQQRVWGRGLATLDYDQDGPLPLTSRRP